MLEALQGKKVTIYFLDCSNESKGVLEAVSDKFVKYRTDYQELYIPITSIRSVDVDTKERQRARVGFGQ
ncbi:hypothetical protein GCM10010912_63840 [Paenibacillus albidus]|uniref:Uncharacterized protein n=1 Tax=Paenibacillus albidus TaxID=2041023 RepID=A0A917FXE4_9BACL|nr:hypothetical protein [Paenibacillus albidus]GGG10661.1 hypothetical protein GCM10010912_63840 [Paenibacillus albidus]